MSMRSRNQHTLPFSVGTFWEIGQLEIWDVPFTSHGIKEITGEETETALLHDGLPKAKATSLFVTGELYSLDKEPLMGDPKSTPNLLYCTKSTATHFNR